jgi:hypothetical protein
MAVIGEARAIVRVAVEILGVQHGIAARRISMIVGEVRAAIALWPDIPKETGVGVSLKTISDGHLAVAQYLDQY